jgi:hypothetical protein
MIYPLLDENAEGNLCSEAKDVGEAAPPSRETYLGVVSEKPARINLRAALETKLEVEWALSVLRNPGKLRKSRRVL